jgi:hypothetical protein
MQEIGRQERTRLIISITLIASIAAVFAYLAISGRLSPMVGQLWEIFKDRDQMRDYVQSWGAWAPGSFHSHSGIAGGIGSDSR